MVRHLLSSHRFISTYNYTHRITKQAIEEISIPELITLAQAPHIRKVYIVDRSSPFYFEHILDDLEPSFAVEILPYGERPHSGCEFLRRNGGEEVLLLLGMAIYAVGVRMGKSVVIYCGEGRAGKVESLCGEVGVRARVVVGKGKKATRIDVRPAKTLAVSDRTVKLIKLEQ